MILIIAVVTLCIPWMFASASSEHQIPLEAAVEPSDTPNTDRTKHIAIIGAGIGGAVTAFDLHERNRNSGFSPVKVTIFEREAEVGGRIHSSCLYPLQGSIRVIEEGAAHFFTDDRCLGWAMHNVGLSLAERMRPPRFGSIESRISYYLHQTLALLNFKNWSLPPSPFRPDPDKIRTDLKCNAGAVTWKDYLRLRWRYGRSWPIFQSAVRSARKSWDEFGEFPPSFNSITEASDVCGIDEATYNGAEAYLRNLSISVALQNEYIQPCLRGRFSQNLADVSGFFALLAAGKSTMTSVESGNSRLVERLIRLSEADVQLNTIVTGIKLGVSKRYQLSVSRPDSNASSRDIEFDLVILAAPLESSGIDVDFVHSASLPDPRIDTYVTHFSSSRWVSDNLTTIPLDVEIETDEKFTTSTLTTSALYGDPNILSIQQSHACFSRGCLLGSDCDQCDDDDKLYRIHSREPLEDSDLLRLLGPEVKGNDPFADYSIGVVYRRAWPSSYPQARNVDAPLNFVDEVEIAPDVYYLNGAEGVISSMEMSCRMARNVANKVYRRWSPSWL